MEWLASQLPFGEANNQNIFKDSEYYEKRANSLEVYLLVVSSPLWYCLVFQFQLGPISQLAAFLGYVPFILYQPPLPPPPSFPVQQTWIRSIPGLKSIPKSCTLDQHKSLRYFSRNSKLILHTLILWRSRSFRCCDVLALHRCCLPAPPICL